MKLKPILILYVPVLHEGYINIFSECRKFVSACYILGDEFIKEFTFLEKEIRAIEPGVIRGLVDSLGFFEKVEVLDRRNAERIFPIEKGVITANESVSRRFAEKYLSSEIVNYVPVFLRWDEKSVFSQEVVHYDREEDGEKYRLMMDTACKEAGKSSDWWRRVGAVAVRDGNILITEYNHHLPSEHTPYVFGDPRDSITAGTRSDLSSAIHAEQAIIAEAAKKGIPLEGADIYVSVFPCPVCAKLIASAGFKRCFFGSGHASLDGEKVLEAAKVEIILVK